MKRINRRLAALLLSTPFGGWCPGRLPAARRRLRRRPKFFRRRKLQRAAARCHPRGGLSIPMWRAPSASLPSTFWRMTFPSPQEVDSYAAPQLYCGTNGGHRHRRTLPGAR